MVGITKYLFEDLFCCVLTHPSFQSYCVDFIRKTYNRYSNTKTFVVREGIRIVFLFFLPDSSGKRYSNVIITILSFIHCLTVNLLYYLACIFSKDISVNKQT